MIALILAAMAWLAGMWFLQQEFRQRRIAARANDEMWGAFQREIALAAAAGNARFAWIALGLGWIALVIEAIR